MQGFENEMTTADKDWNRISNNIDIPIDLTDEGKETAIIHYIRSTMSRASYEVFEREYAAGDLYEATAKALLNEAMVELIIIGMLIDKDNIGREE